MGELAIQSEARLPLRDAFNGWFVTHEVAWELAMAALAVLYVALGFLVDDLPAGDRPEVGAAELALTGIFILEFGSRILAARRRTAYLRGHWIDIVALAPPIRGARALRLLRLVRTFSSIYRAGLHLNALARHKGFAWLLLAWLGVMALCSAWMYVAERGLNKAIDSPFDALWWGVVTLTTVGYGDVYPVTTEGRIAAMALMLLGIGLFGAITATITSYLMTRDIQQFEEHEAESSLAGELERLAALHSTGALTDAEFSSSKASTLGQRATTDHGGAT